MYNVAHTLKEMMVTTMQAIVTWKDPLPHMALSVGRESGYMKLKQA